MTDRKSYPLRLDDLKEAAVKRAKQGNRSLNAYIINLIQRDLKIKEIK